MSRISRRLASFMLATWITSGATGLAADTTSNPWRIEVDGSADRHGEIVFSFEEDGVEITQIPVAIPKGTPENAVARRIRKELRRALPKDQYDVGLEGGEKVVTSVRGHAKEFELRLVRNTVSGTEIVTARE